MQISTKVQVGQTDLFVSLVGLGTAPLADPLFGSTPKDRAIETIQVCLDNGINYFDTAPKYGSGLAEQYLGNALAGVPRDQYVISTKVGRLIQDEVISWDFSRDGVLRSIDESLKRLKCDSVDILLLHDPDNYYHQALDEAFPALAELRSQGVVKAIGAGMNRWPMLVDFAHNADFDCFMLAGRYTLIEQGALEFLDLCHEKKIGILMAGVYNSGILATGAKPGAKYNYSEAAPEIVEQVNRLESICQRYDIPLKVAALQFPLGHPATTTLVLGTSSPTRVADYITSLQTSIPSNLWDDLKAEGLLDASAPVPQISKKNMYFEDV